jgi:hypothetical protein
VLRPLQRRFVLFAAAGRVRVRVAVPVQRQLPH